MLSSVAMKLTIQAASGCDGFVRRNIATGSGVWFCVLRLPWQSASTENTKPLRCSISRAALICRTIHKQTRRNLPTTDQAATQAFASTHCISRYLRHVLRLWGATSENLTFTFKRNAPAVDGADRRRPFMGVIRFCRSFPSIYADNRLQITPLAALAKVSRLNRNCISSLAVLVIKAGFAQTCCLCLARLCFVVFYNTYNSCGFFKGCFFARAGCCNLGHHFQFGHKLSPVVVCGAVGFWFSGGRCRFRDDQNGAWRRHRHLARN